MSPTTAKSWPNYFRSHAATIASALGMTAAQLEAISKAPPMDRTVKVRVALRRFRERHAESLRRQAQNLSIAAADMLVGLSRWHQERVDVDAKIVLGTLLADGQRKAIRFDVEGRSSVTILRDKLKEARRALGFSDLRCFIDERGLNFRWHGGRGGLVLITSERREVRIGRRTHGGVSKAAPKGQAVAHTSESNHSVVRLARGCAVGLWFHLITRSPARADVTCTNDIRSKGND